MAIVNFIYGYGEFCFDLFGFFLGLTFFLSNRNQFVSAIMNKLNKAPDKWYIIRITIRICVLLPLKDFILC